MKRIFLLRHGQTVLDGRYVGATDATLSPVGMQEIVLLRQFFSDIPLDTIIVSPLHRCVETYKLLNICNQYTIDERIKEINFGRWESKSFSEILESDEQLVKEWGQNPYTFTFPEGECISDFKERVLNFTQHLLHAKDQNVLIVSHGGVIRYLICFLLGLPQENAMKFRIATGKITIIDHGTEYVELIALNTGGQHG